MILSEEKDKVVCLDFRRLLILGVVAALCLAAMYSYIITLFAFIAPSQDFPLGITGVATFTAGNNPQSSFVKGATVRINATVEMATHFVTTPPNYFDFVGDTSYRIIFTVMDGSNSPMFFQSTKNTISPGAVQVTNYDYTIPSDATTGTYTIRVVVWSDWLPSGLPLAPWTGVQTFQVTYDG